MDKLALSEGKITRGISQLKSMRKDRFTDEALRYAEALASIKSEDAESFAEAYDFARCQRADGSFYGIPEGKQCKKGTKASPIDQGAKRQREGQKPVVEKPKRPKTDFRKEVEAGAKKRREREAGMEQRQKEEARLRRALAQVLAKERNARRDGDDESAKKFMRASIKINKRLDEVEGARLTGAAPKRQSPAKKKESEGKGTPEQRMQLERLRDRMDDAVTVKEQQRISSAIKDLERRMRG